MKLLRYARVISIISDPLRRSSVKIGTIQRRLAWPLRKDDTQNREAFHIFSRCLRSRNYKPFWELFYIKNLNIYNYATTAATLLILIPLDAKLPAVSEYAVKTRQKITDVCVGTVDNRTRNFFSLVLVIIHEIMPDCIYNVCRRDLLYVYSVYLIFLGVDGVWQK